MATYRVTMTGESREIYSVEAETHEEAEKNWMNGDLVLQESSSMEIYEVREEDD